MICINLDFSKLSRLSGLACTSSGTASAGNASAGISESGSPTTTAALDLKSLIVSFELGFVKLLVDELNSGAFSSRRFDMLEIVDGTVSVLETPC